MEYIIVVILGILFAAFLYWAYLPDYKMNPKEFWKTLIGMPIGLFLGFIGFGALNEAIRKWAVEKKKSNKND
ncbi:hypothetical protein QYR09_11670 [Cellulophaga lytica]|nr:hypothetical protein QYR09_11670 [Cellulophaga lytica]